LKMKRLLVAVVLVSLLCNGWSQPSGARDSQVRRVMPWMCLERCGKTGQGLVEIDLKQITSHASVLAAVSFEMYNLGPNSTLVLNNLTQVCPTIKKAGLETYPMISSYPYPPQFIEWMRQVFANPQPFITQCLQQATMNGFTGFNIDWEPNEGATAEDAQLYANFLTTFANAMHKNKFKVTVDVAQWSPIWNFTLLGQTTVDRVMNMETYSGNDTQFIQELDYAIETIGLEKLGVGVQIVNPTTSELLTQSQVEFRFVESAKRGVQEIDIWRSPLPPYWWPVIGNFSDNTTTPQAP